MSRYFEVGLIKPNLTLSVIVSLTSEVFSFFFFTDASHFILRSKENLYTAVFYFMYYRNLLIYYYKESIGAGKTISNAGLI